MEETNPSNSDVLVGGVSVRTLEERVRTLEALLKKHDTAQVPVEPPIIPDVPFKAGGNRASQPPMADAEKGDDQPLVKHLDEGHSSDDGEKIGCLRRPTYTRMHRRYIEAETLIRFQIPFVIDPHDPEYFLIQRWVPEREQDQIWKHTTEIRKRRQEQVRGRDVSPFPHPEDSWSRPSLEARIDRMPYEDWKTDNKDSCVLVVATDIISGGGDTALPVRLTINSRHVWRGLRRTTTAEVDAHAAVMLPPWKILVTYEKKIRKYMEELEQYPIERERKRAQREEQAKAAHETFDKPLGDNEAVDPIAEPLKSEKKNLESKRTRFADERLEIGDKRLSDGSADLTVVKVHDLCSFCNSVHEEEFDCAPEVISHWRCLIEFMDKDLHYIFKLRSEIDKGTATDIAFADLWHLFNPGDIVISSEPRRAFTVFNVNGGRPCLTKCKQYEKRPRVNPLRVECIFYDCRLQGFLPVHETVIIPDFGGKLPIKSLQCGFLVRATVSPIVSVYPIQFEKDVNGVMASLVKRGKRVLEMFSFSHKYYHGMSSVGGDWLESEIIIDVESPEFDRQALLGRQGLFGHVDYDVREIAEGCTHLPPTDARVQAPGYQADCRCWSTIDDFFVDSTRSEKYTGDSELLLSHTPTQRDLSDDKLMMFGPDIRAYLLSVNQWWTVDVDQIHDLSDDFKGRSRQQRTFKELYLPEDHEALLKAVIKRYKGPGFAKRCDDTRSYQHFKNKGAESGLRLLFHGGHGVGKSSTAEAIANYTGRPLYHIRSSDLSREVEELQNHLRRAQHWHCIVLIHEAEIFFARRDPRQVSSSFNACMVACLEVLDSYSGILIMATRRLKTFDDVFLSGVHLAFYFPPLDKDGAMQVWKTTIQDKLRHESKQFELGGIEDILAFVSKQWDEGTRWDARQIKNVIETALALAGGENDDGTGQMTLKHVSRVVVASNSFAEYHKKNILEQDEEDKVQIGGGWKTSGDSWEYLPKRGARMIISSPTLPDPPDLADD